MQLHGSWLLLNLCSRYDVIVDVAPQVKWIPENGYKNLKIVVEIDSDIDARRASEKELRRRNKSLGSMRIVTDKRTTGNSSLSYSSFINI